MAILDTLEILIEADSRGLETQLKKSATTISSFVDKMNSQEVNWQSILAGSLDTAIIAGIASSFALAITQAMQFQNSMLDVSNNTASAFGNSAGATNDAVLALAGTTGASLSDTAAAYQAFYKQFGDAAVAQQLTAEAGKLALASNQSLSSLMPQLIELFNQWGITTLPAAQDALTGLANEAGKGKFSLDELIGVIGNQGQALQGVTNINAMATQIQALSNQAGLSKNSVVDAFNAIAAGVANPIASIDVLNGGVGSMAKNLRQPDGLISAFQDASKTIRDMGAAGVTMGQQMGFSLGTASQLGATAAEAFLLAKKAADQATASQQPLNDILDKNLSTTDHLQQDYQKLLSILTQNVGMPVLEGLDALLKDIVGLFDKNTFLTSMGDMFDNLILKNPMLNLGGGKGVGAIDVPSILTNLMSTLFGTGSNNTKPLNNAVSGNSYAPVANAPTPNATSNQNGSNVTLNLTNNVSGTGANAKGVGDNIATQLYNLFVGTNPLFK